MKDMISNADIELFEVTVSEFSRIKRWRGMRGAKVTHDERILHIGHLAEHLRDASPSGIVAHVGRGLSTMESFTVTFEVAPIDAPDSKHAKVAARPLLSDDKVEGIINRAIEAYNKRERAETLDELLQFCASEVDKDACAKAMRNVRYKQRLAALEAELQAEFDILRVDEPWEFKDDVVPEPFESADERDEWVERARKAYNRAERHAVRDFFRGNRQSKVKM